MRTFLGVSLVAALAAMSPQAATACAYNFGSGWTSAGGGTPAQLMVLGNESCQGLIHGETLRVVAPPQHGKVRITGPSTYIYTPRHAYRGPDQMTVSAIAGGVGLVVGTVVIQVHSCRRHSPGTGRPPIAE